MSTTLSRRLRRIGILQTTFNETQEQRLVTEIVEGKKQQVEKTITKRTPVRNRVTLSPEERALAETTISTTFAEKHLAFRAKRKEARVAARSKKISKVVVKSSTIGASKKAA
jgi:hypothetical protein